MTEQGLGRGGFVRDGTVSDLPVGTAGELPAVRASINGTPMELYAIEQTLERIEALLKRLVEINVGSSE